LKRQIVGVFKRCAWSLPVLAGLLLVLLISGGKSFSQQPANANTNAAELLKVSATPGQTWEPGTRGRKSQRRYAEAQATTGVPGEFDFYLLSLSWSPGFCATHRGGSECGRRLGFVVHGMWPQYGGGDYPVNCSDAPGPANPRAYTDMIPTASLVEHEWKKHGTCSGMTANAYFTAIRKAFAGVRIPAGIGTGRDAGWVAPERLLEAFAKANPGYPEGSFVLSCGDNRLTAIEVCLSKDLQPQRCRGVWSCRADVIEVTAR
jgi:ribonuclease T2